MDGNGNRLYRARQHGRADGRRLIEAGHKLIVYDTRNDAVAPLVALGAKLASSPQDVADRVETVMASLPSLQISAEGRDSATAASSTASA